MSIRNSPTYQYTVASTLTSRRDMYTQWQKITSDHGSYNWWRVIRSKKLFQVLPVITTMRSTEIFRRDPGPTSKKSRSGSSSLQRSIHKLGVSGSWFLSSCCQFEATEWVQKKHFWIQDGEGPATTRWLDVFFGSQRFSPHLQGASQVPLEWPTYEFIACLLNSPVPLELSQIHWGQPMTHTLDNIWLCISPRDSKQTWLLNY